jgi:uncharacterized membrane protein
LLAGIRRNSYFVRSNTRNYENKHTQTREWPAIIFAASHDGARSMARLPPTALQFCQRLESNAAAAASTAVQQMKAMEDELPAIKQKARTPTLAAIDVNADSQSIVLNAPVAEVYRRCLRFEDFPRFITSITDTEKISDTRFSCTSIINGESITSEVEIIMRVPDRRIVWHAVSDQFRVGVVSFDPLPSGATRVTVKVRSITEPVMLTGALRSYLKNFKRFVEKDVRKV